MLRPQDIAFQLGDAIYSSQFNQLVLTGHQTQEKANTEEENATEMEETS